jgi:hypothetical protein
VVWCSLSVDVALGCKNTARKQIYQLFAIRDFGMYQIFTEGNSWRDKKKQIVVNSLRTWKGHNR